MSETQQKNIDNTYSKLEGYKNEIVILLGILSAVVGLIGFMMSNWLPISIEMGNEGLGWVFGFSAGCFGIGKMKS